jgi:TRAP-type C4-dicarboxylate transport system substrate-binding protein
VLRDAAVISRDFERKDTRAEAGKALADLKGKGMQINELSPAETARMRDKLTAVNATIATNVGMDLWNETQALHCRPAACIAGVAPDPAVGHRAHCPAQ